MRKYIAILAATAFYFAAFLIFVNSIVSLIDENNSKALALFILSIISLLIGFAIDMELKNHLNKEVKE